MAKQLRHLKNFGVLLFFATCDIGSAAPKPWVLLTNCLHIAGKDNDGDSFRVRSGTNEFIFRLYFVDAPETNLRYPERTWEQSEYFGITLDETIMAGARAREVVGDLLQKPFVVRTRWAHAPGRGREPRYYGFVEIDGKGLAEILVSQGLARIKGVFAALPNGEKAKVYAEKLRRLEAEARQKKLGAWAHSKKQQAEVDPP